MSDSECTVSVKNIYKKFGNREVLQDLSLSLHAGTVFGLVGLNGTGKTTLIRILLGLLEADSGTSTVLGMNPAEQRRGYYRRVGVVLEHNGFFGNLTVRDNLSFFAGARGVSKQEMENYFNLYWSDTAIGNDTKRVKYYSRGQKMQCALCRAFLGWPEVYFLDEPVAALDMEAYNRFCAMIRKAQAEGATIIISSHQLDAIEDLCTSVGILENGSISLLEGFSEKKNGALWYVRTERNENYKKDVERITGGAAELSDGYIQFTVSEPCEEKISALVACLVSRGASVFEVRPESRSFRKSIRQFYTGKV